MRGALPYSENLPARPSPARSKPPGHGRRPDIPPAHESFARGRRAARIPGVRRAVADCGSIASACATHGGTHPRGGPALEQKRAVLANKCASVPARGRTSRAGRRASAPSASARPARSCRLLSEALGAREYFRAAPRGGD